MNEEHGSDGANREDRIANLSSLEDRRVYCNTVVEQIREIKEKGKLDGFLARCRQMGVSRRTIGRWLKAPDTAANGEKLNLVASALKEFGVRVDDALYRDLVRQKRRENREAAARALQEKVDQALDATRLVQHNSARVTVLFSDQVDSSNFKQHSSEIDWLARTRLHNRVAEECVSNFGGRVIKFLGDGVLAEFEGTEHAQRAMEAGLAIIEAIEAQGPKHGYEGAKSIETAVGVATGKVFRFTFEQTNEPDPQGSTVDLAYRLCDLAGPQQLICSEACFDAAGGEETFTNSSKELECFVKGFDEPMPIRVVLPEGTDCLGLRLVGHKRETRPENVALLGQARQAFDRLANDKKEFDNALKAYGELITKEPGNFEANVRLAELYLVRAARKVSERRLVVERAIEHLRRARQINPESWRVWLMASEARRYKFEDSRDYADLEQAIKHAEQAVDKAEAFVDGDGMHKARLVLAQLLLLRSGDPAKDGAADLSHAAALCDDIKDAFNGVQTRRRAECKITAAMVQIAQGKKAQKSLDEIEELIKQAAEADPKNKNVYLAKARLIEVRAEREA